MVGLSSLTIGKRPIIPPVIEYYDDDAAKPIGILTDEVQLDAIKSHWSAIRHLHNVIRIETYRHGLRLRQ